MSECYRAQITVQHTSGLPRDAITNTWHFIAPDDTLRATAYTSIENRLEGFYGDIASVLFSSKYAWSTATLDVYDFHDPRPRIPFATTTVDLGTPTAAAYDYPPEVAIVLTMQAELLSGTNKRRSRGRVYLGPLAVGAADLQEALSGHADAVANAADGHLLSAGTTQLAIYSPYTHHNVPVGENIKDYPGEVAELTDVSFKAVVTCWCDNAWDTQRRRGRTATYRKTVT